MKCLFLLIAFSFWLGHGKAQTVDLPPTTTMALEVLTPLNFVYASHLDLLQPKVLPQAIKLKLKVKQEACLISAQVSINNTSTSPFADKFALKLAQTNSLNSNHPVGDIELSQAPKLLFIQPGSTGGVKHYQYLFDLKLNPPETYGGPTFTNFSIVYTISLQ